MTLRKRSQAAGGSLADQLEASITGTRVPPHPKEAEPAKATLGPATFTRVITTKTLPPGQPSPVLPTLEELCRGKTDPAPPPLYQSANLGDGVAPDFQRIVETVYAADAFRDYDDLEKHLEVGEQRGDYSTLREHLDKAEGRARRAHRLYLGAKLERAKWELDSKKVQAGMRKAATKDLQDDPERSKRITNDDVDAKMADLFPDEVQAQELTRVKLKGVEETLEHLTRRWDAKCSDLRTLIETLRK